jgi:hypothetical protein
MAIADPAERLGLCDKPPTIRPPGFFY